MKSPTLAVIVSAGMLAFGAFAQKPTQPAQPDNTKMNRAESNRAVNADKQSNGSDDLKLAKDIRKSVVSDKSLSTYAHNVKIITNNGMVTLKGPVRSEDEKKAIVEKAVQAAGGADKVTDQMTVKPESK